MSISNDQIYDALLGIKGDIGELKADNNSTRTWLAQHVQDDKELTERVNVLSSSYARQRGAAKVWSLIGAATGAALGAAASFFGARGH